MNKLYVYIAICSLTFLTCCSTKDEPCSNVWGEAYPWLGKIMTDADHGKYKDGSGRKAYVTIELLKLNRKYFIGLNYGFSGGLLYDEIRDMDGRIVHPGTCQTIGKIYPIMEVGLDVLISVE